MKVNSIHLMIFFLCLSCKQFNRREFSNDQIENESTTQEGDFSNKLLLGAYNYNDSGQAVALRDPILLDIQSTTQQNPQKQMPPVASQVKEFLSFHPTLSLGNLSKDLYLNIAVGQAIPKSTCAFMALDSKTGYLYLDPYKRIEDMIINLNYEVQLGTSGILCFDNKGKLVAAATNEELFSEDEGEMALLSYLEGQGIALAAQQGPSLRFRANRTIPIPNSRTLGSNSKGKGPSSASLPRAEASYKTWSPLRKAGEQYSPLGLDEAGINDLRVGSRGSTPRGGSYEIESFLGQGTFGKVYAIKITEKGFERRYALKILDRPNPTNKYANQLDPSPYFLHNIETGNPRYQIQQLGGRNLDDILSDGHLRAKSADPIRAQAIRGEVFRDIFNAFDYLQNKKNFAHWDIKPENFVVRGTVRVIDLDDLGPAELVRESIEQVEAGVLDKRIKPVSAMTQEFAAPERLISIRSGQSPAFPRSPTKESGDPTRANKGTSLEQISKTFDDDLSAANKSVPHDEQLKDLDGKSSDIYSLGMTLFVAKYGKKSLSDLVRECCGIEPPPGVLFQEYLRRRGYPEESLTFRGPNYREIHPRLVAHLKTLPDNLERRELALITSMIDPTPSKRPNISSIKERWDQIHPPEPIGRNEAQKVFSGTVNKTEPQASSGGPQPQGQDIFSKMMAFGTGSTSPSRGSFLAETFGQTGTFTPVVAKSSEDLSKPR